MIFLTSDDCILRLVLFICLALPSKPSLECHPRLTHSWCWRCWWCTWWWCWCSRGCLLSAALCLALLPLPPTSECCCWFKFRAGGRTLPLSHSLISSKSHCTQQLHRAPLQCCSHIALQCKTQIPECNLCANVVLEITVHCTDTRALCKYQSRSQSRRLIRTDLRPIGTSNVQTFIQQLSRTL